MSDVEWLWADVQSTRVLKATGAVALAPVLGGAGRVHEGRQQAGEKKDSRRRLRTITYNVFQCSGIPMNEGTRERLTVARKRMDARFAVELFVYEADIISFQEAPAEPGVAAIAQALEMNYCFFPSRSCWDVAHKNAVAKPQAGRPWLRHGRGVAHVPCPLAPFPPSCLRAFVPCC